MKRYLLILLCCATSVTAQDMHERFQEFRKGLKTDFEQTRQEYLSAYADFLDKAWQEMTALKGKERDPRPKPATPPTVKERPTTPPPPAMEEPEIPTLPAKPTEPKPEKPKPVNPVTPPAPVKPNNTMMVSFYDNQLPFPKANSHRLSSLEPSDVARVWRNYATGNIEEQAQAIQSHATRLNLNGWFTFELIGRYADELLSSATPSDRIVLRHCLLIACGYDVLLCRGNNQLYLLSTVSNTVYARPFLQVYGKNYYLFGDTRTTIPNESVSLACSVVPGDQQPTGKLTMRIDPLQKAGQVHAGQMRTISDGRLDVKVYIDQTIMEMLRYYPQTDMPNYAKSEVMPVLHESILQQLRPQIQGLSETAAVNALLHFVQYGFDYATDQDQHGYEKPYFIEENFYYPKNDCEDRSIFFAFLVRNLLHLDVHLVNYPGHECTGIAFTDQTLSGHGYRYNDRRYLICDPTYIGAKLGMCMDQYVQETPKIEIW